MHNVLPRSLQERYLELMKLQDSIPAAYAKAHSPWDRDGIRAVPYAITALLCLFIAPVVAPQWNDHPTVDNYLMLGVAFAVFFTPLCVLIYLHWELRSHIPRRNRRYQEAETLQHTVDKGLAQWACDAESALLAAGKWHVLQDSARDVVCWEPRSVLTTVIGDDVWMMDVSGEPVMASVEPKERIAATDSAGTRILLTDEARKALEITS